MTINTKHVSGRRALHFTTMPEIGADARAITAAPHQTLGNWSAAQIIEHLARFIHASRVGFPHPAPWWLRLLGRAMRSRMLRTATPAGIRPPGRFTDPFMPGPEVTLDAARQHLQDEIAAASTPGAMQQPSPLLGPLSHDQWVQLHCRHAEMHLSFIAPT